MNNPSILFLEGERKVGYKAYKRRSSIRVQFSLCTGYRRRADVTAAVYFLVRDAAKYVTGQVLYVTGDAA
ncbi:MAG: hypothetical protein HKO68_18015 [Desulfobacterales bacterium]|nr:hypothetical protein [Desulfobacterales bacterium]